MKDKKANDLLRRLLFAVDKEGGYSSGKTQQLLLEVRQYLAKQEEAPEPEAEVVEREVRSDTRVKWGNWVDEDLSVKLIRKFGMNYQFMKLAEEAAETTGIVLKFKNNFFFDDGGVYEAQDLMPILKEVADNLFTIGNLLLIYPKEIQECLEQSKARARKYL